MKKSLVIVILWLIIYTPTFVFANGGPIKKTGTTNTIIIPTQSNSISITEEKLDYSIKEETLDNGQTTLFAEVNVIYKMKNENNKLEYLTVIFPYYLGENFKVLFNGNDVNTKFIWVGGMDWRSINGTDKFTEELNQIPSFDEIISNLNKKSDISFDVTEKKFGQIRFAVFELDFLPISTNELTVSYIEKPTLKRDKGFFIQVENGNHFFVII